MTPDRGCEVESGSRARFHQLSSSCADQFRTSDYADQLSLVSIQNAWTNLSHGKSLVYKGTNTFTAVLTHTTKGSFVWWPQPLQHNFADARAGNSSSSSSPEQEQHRSSQLLVQYCFLCKTTTNPWTKQCARCSLW